MRFIAIVKEQKAVDEKMLRDFIYKNFSPEMLRGLEQDDPDTIRRALKMMGLSADKVDLSTYRHPDDAD